MSATTTEKDFGQEAATAVKTDAAAQLAELRQSIDNIDTAMIAILAERFRCTQAVGELKARSAMPAADPAREARQIARLRALATNSRLDPDFAEKFLNFIIREVIRHHEAIARDARATAPTPPEAHGGVDSTP